MDRGTTRIGVYRERMKRLLVWMGIWYSRLDKRNWGRRGRRRSLLHMSFLCITFRFWRRIHDELSSLFFREEKGSKTLRLHGKLKIYKPLCPFPAKILKVKSQEGNYIDLESIQYHNKKQRGLLPSSKNLFISEIFNIIDENFFSRFTINS